MANNPTYSPDAHRREQTAQKTSKSVKTVYRYVDDDILILSGKYDGRNLSDVWQNGNADDRDSLFLEFWKKDEIARNIMLRDCAKND